MEPAKSSDYYFPGVLEVERAQIPDDEFDGVRVDFDDKFMERLQRLSADWREALLAAQLFAQIDLDEEYAHGDDEPYETVFVSKVTKTPPAVQEWNTHFWLHDSQAATRQGWHWSGDTEVSVRIVHASTLLDLIVSYILWRGECRINWNCPVTEQEFESWTAFWDLAVRSKDHDLPEWTGKPRGVVLDSDGNCCIAAAEKDKGEYYVVTYYTS